MPSITANNNLHKAKNAKKDEFYTQLEDIENELRHYIHSYESSLNTENTLKLMLYKNLVILVVLSIPFFLSIFSKGGSDIIRILFEISIPLTLLSDFVILFVYFQNVTCINERFKIEFTNLENENISESDVPKLLIPVIEYYSIKSWANTNLDSKIFNTNDEKISENWKKRKKKLKK